MAEVKILINPDRLIKDLQIDPNDLTSAFSDQAGHFAYYSAKSTTAAQQFERFDQRVNLVEALVDKGLRDQAVDCGEKITETYITRQLSIDPRVVKARRQANDAKAVYRICKDAVQSFRQRKDMLIQMGADAREEKKGKLTMGDGLHAGQRARQLMSQLNS